jgi:dolichyl-phosphate-mannose-protein mannosyltransferase
MLDAPTRKTAVLRLERVAARFGGIPVRWRVASLLALPYLVTVAALRGLTSTMPTFHGGDEVKYHLPTIRQFAHQLPGVDLVHYPAAQTPLFHLLVAVWGKVVGLELWRLRVVEVVVSYLVVLVLYRLLRRHAGLGAWPAALLAGLFGCSPYVFGQSFILVTDNLGLLFGLLAIERLLACARGARFSAFAIACGWIALALLTRQSYPWLGLLALLVLLLRGPRDRRDLLAGLGLLALAAVPFGALVIVWHGFVPPTADPASCGLCKLEPGRLSWSGDSPLRAPLFTLAVVGVYGPLTHGPALLAGRRRWALPAAAALAGAALLVVLPLARHVGDEGWLWRLARSGPRPLGTAWPFWLLVPAGCAVLAAGVRREGARALPVLLLGCFLLAQLATRLTYQKYFEPFVLLTCLLALRPDELRARRDWIGPALVLALSLAYVAAFALGAIAVES